MARPDQMRRHRPAKGRGSLQLRLLLTLAAALLPILLLAGWQSWTEARDSVEQRRDDLIVIANDAISEVQSAFRLAETMLGLFEADIHDGQCAEAFERIHPFAPFVSNIAAFDADDAPKCLAVGDPAQVGRANVKDRFLRGEDIIRTDAFFGTGSQAWIFTIHKRVVGADGQFAGSVAVGIRAEAMTDVIGRLSLPEGVEIALADTNLLVFGGTRSLDLTPEMLTQAAQSPAGHLFTETDRSGEKLDLVIRPIGSGNIYAIISRPEPGILSAFWVRPVSSIGLPLLAFAFTLVAAWAAIDHLVLRWLDRLRRLAIAYGAGRYEFRSEEEFSAAPHEIADFAHTFNLMASHIEERDRSLLAAVESQEDAVREIHHRVKNNLQIVTSFLNLQSRKVTAPEARRALDIARNRINALSIIHQTLYQHDRLQSVHLRPFLERLIGYLAEALGINERGLKLDARIDPAECSADEATPIALFLVEALTNTVKYAFPGNEPGAVSVRLENTGDSLILKITDDGVGVDPDADPAGGGVGQRLMTAFARQLGGVLQTQTAPGEGTALTLQIPR